MGIVKYKTVLLPSFKLSLTPRMNRIRSPVVKVVTLSSVTKRLNYFYRSVDREICATSTNATVYTRCTAASAGHFTRAPCCNDEIHHLSD